ncbi:uncharacterized protein L199_004230 [Kwoniella botswanensis]|uniref:uncharacterized protein n=1 Tax=Kwoniella botswanensis TaxID=1268659 RepID=UPI00315CD7C2
MMTLGLPLLLRFLSDRQYEVPIAVAPFASDLLKVYKRIYKPPAMPPPAKAGQPQPPTPSPPPPLTPQRREFLASMLDILIRQLAWPEDAEWEAPGSEEDSDDEMALFRTFRIHCRAYIESIAQIEKGLHTEVVARIVVATLDAFQAGGPSAVPWQQAELALHLIYTFGELSKSDGRSTPTSDIAEAEVDYGTAKENFDYDQYPLSPLGELLKRCMASGISTYPHPSVTLQYFEISVRYVEFWRYKPEAIQPMFEAILDNR